MYSTVFIQNIQYWYGTKLLYFYYYSWKNVVAVLDTVKLKVESVCYFSQDVCKRLKEHINVAVEVKIQTLRVEQEKLNVKANELLKQGEESVKNLLGRIRDIEETVSNGPAFDAVSENRKKVVKLEYKNVLK